jgi:hypothetical protein
VFLYIDENQSTRFPRIGEGSERKLKLGVKGEKSKVEEAMAWLKNGITVLGFKWVDKRK